MTSTILYVDIHQRFTHDVTFTILKASTKKDLTPQTEITNVIHVFKLIDGILLVYKGVHLN